MAGDRASAEQAGREAIEVLEQAGDSRLLALALSNEAQLCMLAHRLAEGVEYGERAVALARAAGDAAITSHALTNVGSCRWMLGDPAGRPALEEALRVALAAGATEAEIDTFQPASCVALTVAGRVRARRGQPRGTRLLSSAWKLAVQIDELQRLAPVAAARAEDAWLCGDHARARDIAGPVYAEAVRLGDDVH